MKAWEWGRTLRGGKGSTQSTAGGPDRTMRSLYAGGIAIVATIAGSRGPGARVDRVRRCQDW